MIPSGFNSASTLAAKKFASPIPKTVIGLFGQI